ncbi:MAG: glycogen debranching protein [Lachnospiraceae bacterium]|nr:glycogen debranching protein [Lachnospiraceae bacterium]
MEKTKNGIFTTLVEKTPCFYFFKADDKTVEDPYALEIGGRERFGKRNGTQETNVVKDLSRFNLGSENFKTDISDLVLYKLHVRNFTMDHSSGVKAPGTFKGVTEKIPYLKKLGITGILLMPVYEFDECLPGNELNLWGYGGVNTYFFAPKASYASENGKAAEEFADMVKKLHEAGISVFMEIMFGEGTSESLIAGCLRHWAVNYGIDGFRINDWQISVSCLVTDPYLSNCIFMVTDAEERLVNLHPGRILRYNDGFMNDMRRYIKGDEGFVPVLYDYMKNRTPSAGVKYITDHDGFTLKDLYSYDIKHNEANGENGRDGKVLNYSWNCGEEGETKNRKVNKLRLKMMKNALLTTVLSGGVPMLLAGDEFGNSQKGNNNTWCQDNETGWVNWDRSTLSRELQKFVKELLELRKEHRLFHNPVSLSEFDKTGCGMPEISLHGETPWMIDYQPYNRLAGIYFCGAAGKDEIDDDFYIIYNMHWEKHDFRIPSPEGEKFKLLISTDKDEKPDCTGGKVTLSPRTIMILMKERSETGNGKKK